MNALQAFLERGPERRAALENALAYYIPPELRGWLGLANELNPVVSMERAGGSARAVADPTVQGWDKVAAVGDMTSNMANALAPVVLGSSGAVPAVNAVEEALMGFSAASPMAYAARDFVTDEFGGVGFRAYHGSPHDFDRFSLDKIGTGEGAQAYGHGLYFADNEDVARSYRDTLSKIDRQRDFGPDGLAKQALADAGGDMAEAAALIDENIAALTGNPARADRLAAWTAAKERLGAVAPDGRMYEVQINADPNDFLDWDKPLSEQPQVLQRLGMSARPEQDIHDEALRLMTEGNAREPGKMWFDYPELQARIDELQGELDRRAPNMSGQEFYRGGADGDVSNILSQMGYGNPEVQTQALREAGIPGIRYLDAGSRGAGDGSRNYVVFDDKLIDIIRKYGWAAAAPMLATYSISEAEAREMRPDLAQEDKNALSGFLAERGL